MAAASWRALATVSDAFSVMGNSSSTSTAGGIRGRRLAIRKIVRALEHGVVFLF